MKTHEQMEAEFAAVDRSVSSWRVAHGIELEPFTIRREYIGVYFVRWGAFIKIGTAHDVVARRQALETSLPEGDVEPLGWIHIPYLRWRRSNQDRYKHEARIHETLSAYRVRGEWFRDCETVRRFIDRYCYPWPETDGRC